MFNVPYIHIVTMFQANFLPPSSGYYEPVLSFLNCVTSENNLMFLHSFMADYLAHNDAKSLYYFVGFVQP
jgi:hypothetical protein